MAASLAQLGPRGLRRILRRLKVVILRVDLFLLQATAPALADHIDLSPRRSSESVGEGPHRLEQVIQFTDGLLFLAFDAACPGTGTVGVPLHPCGGWAILCR